MNIEKRGHTFKETMQGDFFEVWFEKHLLPELSKDDVIILDNASFHRKKKLFELAEKHNVKIIFPPPYSPELNPIEHFWQWLKKTTSDMLKFCLNFLRLFNCGRYILGNSVRKINLKNSPGISETAINP